MLQSSLCDKTEYEFHKIPLHRFDDNVFCRIKILGTRWDLLDRKLFRTILYCSKRSNSFLRFFALTRPDTTLSCKNAMHDFQTVTGCSTLWTRYLSYFGRYRPTSKCISEQVCRRSISGREDSSAESSIGSNWSYRWQSDVCLWMNTYFSRATTPRRAKHHC